jgi:hypothetical protein
MLDRDYQSFIASKRVSPQTRAVLTTRLQPDVPDYTPRAMTMEQFTTLRSILECVIPQPGPQPTLDLAQRLDQSLIAGQGDGWRYATLPPDAEAYPKGLTVFEEIAHGKYATSFDRLSSEVQETFLRAISQGVVARTDFDLQHWLEDLRARATQMYVSHPDTLAAMGYSGIGDDQGGFVLLGIGKVEAWEPRASDEKLER